MKTTFAILVTDETMRTFPVDYARTMDESTEIAEALRKSFREGDKACVVRIEVMA